LNISLKKEIICLIGGTSESVAIAQLLTEHNFPYIITVTTPSASKLYQKIKNPQIFVGKLSDREIYQLMAQNHITRVIDATHPFAVNISQEVINICRDLAIKYIRYERLSLSIPENNLITYVSCFNYLVVDNSPLKNKRVLLTIGAKFLPLFTNYHHQATLYTRILPYADSLHQAYQSGFECDRIIALRPPINYALEKALWQMWNIEIVVTKAGGKAGGEDIKYQVAKELNIPLIVIQRPNLEYPIVINTLDKILEMIT